MRDVLKTSIVWTLLYLAARTVHWTATTPMSPDGAGSGPFLFFVIVPLSVGVAAIVTTDLLRRRHGNMSRRTLVARVVPGVVALLLTVLSVLVGQMRA